MLKSFKIILVAILILAVIICGVIFWFVSSGNFSIWKNSLSKEKEVPQVTQEQQTKQLRKDYPKTIIGVINFLDTKSDYKSTLKTDDGKVYTLYPPQPKIIYESFGAKDGQRVEVWGRFSKQGNLEWSKMNPI